MNVNIINNINNNKNKNNKHIYFLMEKTWTH